MKNISNLIKFNKKKLFDFRIKFNEKFNLQNQFREDKLCGNNYLDKIIIRLFSISCNKNYHLIEC